MIYIICTSSYSLHIITGINWTHSCRFIAQLVECRTVARRSQVRSPLKPQNLFWALFVSAFKQFKSCFATAKIIFTSMYIIITKQSKQSKADPQILSPSQLIRKFVIAVKGSLIWDSSSGTCLNCYGMSLEYSAINIIYMLCLHYYRKEI